MLFVTFNALLMFAHEQVPAGLVINQLHALHLFQ